MAVTETAGTYDHGEAMLGEPRRGDAFGDLLVAAMERDGRPGAVFEIVEREDGHVRANDASRYFAPSWGTLDDWVYARARGRVLDMGCGAGRSALVLQAAGLDVVGLDISPGAVRVARARGVEQVVEGTIDDPAVEGGFETIVMAGNNLGLLGNRDQASTLLQRLAEVTAPGGQILATAVGREPGSASTSEDAEYEQRNLRRGRFRWQVTMRSRYGRVATPWFDYLFLTPDELDTLIAGTAWSIADTRTRGAAYAVQLRRGEP